MKPTNQKVYNHIKVRTSLTEGDLVESLKSSFDWGVRIRTVDLKDIVRATRKSVEELR